MSGTPESRVIGLSITSFEVIGHETDGDDRVVGAEVILNIEPFGAFLVTVTTKRQYLNDEIRETLGNIEAPQVLFEQELALERRGPFVVNDKVITDEVLEREFGNEKRVGPDLAQCLWADDEQE